MACLANDGIEFIKTKPDAVNELCIKKFLLFMNGALTFVNQWFKASIMINYLLIDDK